MVAETEDSEDESLRDRLPGAGHRAAGDARAAARAISPQLVELADNRHVAEMLARMPHPYGEAEARAFLAMTQIAPGRRRLCADAGRHRHLRRLRRPERHRPRAGTRLLDRRALLEARLCDGGGARAGRPRLPRDRDRRCCMRRPGSSTRPRAGSSTNAASSMPARAC